MSLLQVCSVHQVCQCQQGMSVCTVQHFCHCPDCCGVVQQRKSLMELQGESKSPPNKRCQLVVLIVAGLLRVTLVNYNQIQN